MNGQMNVWIDEWMHHMDGCMDSMMKSINKVSVSLFSAIAFTALQYTSVRTSFVASRLYNISIVFLVPLVAQCVLNFIQNTIKPSLPLPYTICIGNVSDAFLSIQGAEAFYFNKLPHISQFQFQLYILNIFVLCYVFLPIEISWDIQNNNVDEKTKAIFCIFLF